MKLFFSKNRRIDIKRNNDVYRRLEALLYYLKNCAAHLYRTSKFRIPRHGRLQGNNRKNEAINDL